MNVSATKHMTRGDGMKRNAMMAWAVCDGTNTDDRKRSMECDGMNVSAIETFDGCDGTNFSAAERRAGYDGMNSFARGRSAAPTRERT